MNIDYSTQHPIQQSIEHKLKAEFSPQQLLLLNESHQHNVPEGSESHFKVVIVSRSFEGLRQIQRQQQVYRVLAAELAGAVHALTMQTLTPDEWEQDQAVTQSPQCMGGSGKQ